VAISEPVLDPPLVVAAVCVSRRAA
jgi:hypothetical protein